jgi:hypothetical protein
MADKAAADDGGEESERDGRPDADFLADGREEKEFDQRDDDKN